MQAYLAACLVLMCRDSLPITLPAFYVFGHVIGILLISQFWTPTNDVFIGGGAGVGAATGVI